MALTKYKLVNIPETGIRIDTNKVSVILNAELTDDEAEKLLKSGDENIKYYIQEV